MTWEVICWVEERCTWVHFSRETQESEARRKAKRMTGFYTNQRTGEVNVKYSVLERE